jgi:hypothetical protein
MWIKTSDRLPDRQPNQIYSQVACLVWYNNGIEILVFNHEHMVWDGSDGDDFECEISKVSHWMPLPDRPTAENTEGAGEQQPTDQAQNAGK